MESTEILMRREANKIVDSVLENIRICFWKVELLRIIISDIRLKEHMDLINGKLDDNYFVMNLIGKWVSYFQYHIIIKLQKGDMRTDIKCFQKNVDGNDWHT